MEVERKGRGEGRWGDGDRNGEIERKTRRGGKQTGRLGERQRRGGDLEKRRGGERWLDGKRDRVGGKI